MIINILEGNFSCGKAKISLEIPFRRPDFSPPLRKFYANPTSNVQKMINFGQKKRRFRKRLYQFLKNLVGVARLERATACTPCKNASQLHHTPIAFALQKYKNFLYIVDFFIRFLDSTSFRSK